MGVGKNHRFARGRPGWIIRHLIMVAALLVLLIGDAHALVQVDKDGFFLYYPENEGVIAASLWETLPEMVAWLSARGMQIPKPLHILLDEKRDQPEVEVKLIPHLEIRIPIRAPGVLEDGYTEADPWAYYLFKGLCLQGIFGIRGGIPQLAYRIFGEAISPNTIMPPWVEDGICGLLYAQYKDKALQDPFEAALFKASPPPDLEYISNRPQVWPGHLGYRIYGKPFIQWISRNYGWEKILEFLQAHGSGLIPIEIDLKAREVFGKTGIGLWKDFQDEHRRDQVRLPGLLVAGYWGEPFVYWNRSGIYPGKLQIQNRGRYGYLAPDGILWLSEYESSSKITGYKGGNIRTTEPDHIWDPGPGRVAVTRKGHEPWIIVLSDNGSSGFARMGRNVLEAAQWIPAPPGVIQLSGPVREPRGRIAVSGNLNGNWDIWVYDQGWQRLTRAPSIEMDPWWDGDTLVYASNQSGSFQIHQADGTPITQAQYGAIYPRQGKYLRLTSTGWDVQTYKIERLSFAELQHPFMEEPTEMPKSPVLAGKPYNFLDSIRPNYISPDIFAAVTDLQIGVQTEGRDVSGNHVINGALRYSFDNDFLNLRFGYQYRKVGTRYVRYGQSYTAFVGDTGVEQDVDEARSDIKLFVENPLVKGLLLSANYRTWKPLESEGTSGDEFWSEIGYTGKFGPLEAFGALELYTESRQALSLGVQILFGEQILTGARLLAGKTWGEPVFGHDTFRIGGDVFEGYFTDRPSHLFPVRGFDSNLIESTNAVAAGLEFFWPLANLQYGYETLPLFLHRLRLGTFVDAGIAGETLKIDNLLLGAGVELVTSLEIAWGNFSAFRIGVAWPLVQPDFLDQKGPKFVFQIGKPL